MLARAGRLPERIALRRIAVGASSNRESEGCNPAKLLWSHSMWSPQFESGFSNVEIHTSMLLV
jgi:hypothetical protein